MYYFIILFLLKTINLSIYIYKNFVKFIKEIILNEFYLFKMILLQLNV